MNTRMTLAKRGTGVVSAAALLIALAACGDEDEVTVTSGGDSQDEQTTEPAGTDNGTDGTDDGTDTGTDGGTDDGTDGTDDGTDTGTDGGTDTGGDSTAGEEVDPQAFADRLASPGEDTLSSFAFEMTGTMEGAEMAATGQVAYSGDNPAMSFSMTEPSTGMEVQMIMTDGAMYMQMPPLTEPGMWAMMPADMGIDSSDFDQIDVNSMFGEFEDAASITFLGEDTVDGEALDQFAINVDGEVIHLWIDSENLIRQMQSPDLGDDLTITFFDWGQDFEVTAPADDEIQELDF